VQAADPIPYGSPGNYNANTYAFVAQNTGDVIAYFVDGASATHENTVGLLINGVLSSAGFGLTNHTSVRGDSFNLGHVEAGDRLVFVMNDATVGGRVYSDAALNAAYDAADVALHNHVYSTPYSASSGLFGSVPSGIYVGFEDLPFPGSDYNYNDESFVFTNVAVAVPEPEGLALLLTGMGVSGFAIRRGRATRFKLQSRR
jgi:hypothetical protein